MDAARIVAAVTAGLITLAIALVAAGVCLVYGLGHALIAAGALIGGAAASAGWLLLREECGKS